MKSKKINVQHLHRPVIFVFIIITLVHSTIIKGQSKPEVTNLRTEYKTNPIGIDIVSPRLSWEILSRDRNVMQSAYNIKAALTEENLESENDLIWNTGKISSEQSIHLEYKGPLLKSGRRVYWKVKIWDNKGQESEWSETAYYYYSTSLLQKTAVILGKQEDAKVYWILKQNIKNAFQKEFITPNGRLSSNTQTAYVLALAFDLFPENLKEMAAKRLAEDVKRFGHITTGFLGTPLICHVLTNYGYNDLAYMLLFRKQYPSWLYPVTKGVEQVLENNAPVSGDQDIKISGIKNGRVILETGSGEYIFEASND